MNLFVAKKKDDLTIFFETLFANFLAEYNLAFSVADHFTKRLPKSNLVEQNVHILSSKP